MDDETFAIVDSSDDKVPNESPVVEGPANVKNIVVWDSAVVEDFVVDVIIDVKTFVDNIVDSETLIVEGSVEIESIVDNCPTDVEIILVDNS